MRLQRFLARAGVASRRGSERLMTSGRVRVNGVVVSELGSKVDPSVDVVTVDGRPCSITERSRYVMLYKPQGYITTMSDPQGRPTVAELVPSREFPGLFPVGRLDTDTTGLLLLTCDGEMNHRLLAPGRHVDKTYLAEVDGPLTEAEVRAFAAGLTLSDFTAAPAQLEILSSGESSLARVTVHEGKFHQVKRMFSAVGREVTQLHRERFGSLRLDEALAPGAWRELTEEELRALRQDAQMEGA